MKDLEIKLKIDIEPKPLARARTRNVGTFTSFYYTHKHRAEMEELKTAIIKALSLQDKEDIKSVYKNVVEGKIIAIELKLLFVIAIPKSYSKKKRAFLLNQAHTIKPDLDNLEKNILDRGNGILWVDDKMISSVTKRKLWGNEPYIEIDILYREVLQTVE